MENMLKLGPTSEVKYPQLRKAKIWDEGGKTKIVQILISHCNSFITSIQFARICAVDGKLQRSEIHGEFKESKFDIVTFDYAKEYLTSISGLYRSNQLVSIVIGTNKRKYGPFGMIDSRDTYDKPTHFEYNFSPQSSFGGLHGWACSRCVCAIGVYFKPLGSLAEIGAYVGSEPVIKTEL